MAKKIKTLELYHPDVDGLDLIPFTFKFKNTGGYETWEVWSNGKERSEHKAKGEFTGVIAPGHILKVVFKIWDGGYNIEYSCTSNGKEMKDLNNPSPIAGGAIGADVKTEEVTIQF